MSNLLGLISPPAATLTEVNFERQDGKTIVITGGYSGVGLELTKILLEKGANVYVVSRSQEKGDKMMKEIGKRQDENRGKLSFIQIDLADLRSIYHCAQKIIQSEEKVNLLFNMAGVGFKTGETVQGYEPHIGINCLGHYFFTLLLLPLLHKSISLSSELGSTRVIWAGAFYAKNQPNLEKGTILEFVRSSKDGENRKEFGLFKYAVSKVVNWYMCLDLARKDSKVISLTVNVGPLKTDIWKNSPWYVRLLFYPTLRPPKQGAYTCLFAGFDKEVANEAGKINSKGEYRYITPWGHWCPFSPSKQYEEAIERDEPKEVCDWFEERIRIFFDENKDLGNNKILY